MSSYRIVDSSMNDLEASPALFHVHIVVGEQNGRLTSVIVIIQYRYLPVGIATHMGENVHDYSWIQNWGWHKLFKGNAEFLG